MEMLSDGAGENVDPPPLFGEFERDDGVGRLFFGDVPLFWAMSCEPMTPAPGSGLTFGAMLELDLRPPCCRFMMGR